MLYIHAYWIHGRAGKYYAAQKSKRGAIHNNSDYATII